MQLPAEFQQLETLAPALISRATQWFSSNREARTMIQERPGLIPVQVTGDGRVLWADVGEYVFTEWKFRNSVAAAAAGEDVVAFSTDVDLLMEEALAVESLPPAGFIFQVSRCGSTLLARSLARSLDNCVINEASPLHEGLWRVVTDGWREDAALTDAHVTLLRNLIGCLGRRRSAAQRRLFVKFRSWNVVFMRAIRRAFPDVPALFIYRDPAEVLVSALAREPFGYSRLKGTPASAYILGITAEESAAMDGLSFHAAMNAAYMIAAMRQGDAPITFVNYEQLRRETLGELLAAAFGYTPSREQLILMRDQFEFYSKDEQESTRFASDRARKRLLITPAVLRVVERDLARLYEAAERVSPNFRLYG
ncbi:MAG: hypothetical protein H6713_08385 [Myxococcales bacterium]|nr:hypothetical protein [Myxococcales bacterium]MCB9750005.1 hypothetical protein [Myxococcales bacterium]